MALRLGALRDAVLEAGASEETARKASEEAASYKRRLVGIESHLTVLTWMTGTNIALTIAVLFKLFQ